MFNFWTTKPFIYQCDIHSHLINEVDDGSKSKEESLYLLNQLYSLGIKKVITTPHIYTGKYDNTEAILIEKFQQLTSYLIECNCPVELELAAEYFADNSFLAKVKAEKQLLSFGKNYLLFEFSFLSLPLFWKDLIFQLKVQNYTPVLAHPERYLFMHQNFGIIEEMKDLGVKFQINIPSLGEAYGLPVKKQAETLVKKGYVDFLGTDLHNAAQIPFVQSGLKNKVLKNISTELLLNTQLCS